MQEIDDTEKNTDNSYYYHQQMEGTIIHIRLISRRFFCRGEMLPDIRDKKRL